MITAHNLSISFNLNNILENVSFSINPADRIGLIGSNGCGKTTLLKILTGQLQQDNGNVSFNPPDLQVGYLPQAYEFPPDLSIDELIAEIVADPGYLEEELLSLAKSIGQEPGNKTLQDAYDSTLQKIEHYTPPRIHPQEILEIFGLNELSEGILVSQLSGGQKTRLGLAKILIEEPDVLLLDEPTNHLDIAMLEWLEEWINAFAGGVLVVSHDRTFLDNTVNIIFNLDPISHNIDQYQGNYSQYLEYYLDEQEKQLAAYRDQVYEIRKMKQDISKTKNQAYRVEITTTSREPNVRRYAKKVARKAKSREKKLERYLSSDERLEKPGRSWQMKVDFTDGKHHSQSVARLENLCAGYAANSILISNFNHSITHGARIALTGPNGSGKTTLLRTISGQIEPVSGSIKIGANVHIGYMTQEQESLSGNLNALETIQQQTNFSETEIRSFLHYFLFTGDDVFIQVKHLSLGERSRLQLAALIVQGCDFLLLDEPINHLDIPSRTQFEQALSQFDGTILAVVHDRYFIQRFANELWILGDYGTISINHVGQT